MNTKTKRRMMAVTGVIVIVLVVVLAVVGGSSAARNVSVAEAASGLVHDAKVKVSGKVVPNSFSTDNNVLVFSIYDSEADPDAQTALKVRYDGGVSSTFGNDVEAICTGKVGSDGVLQCTELVTKCPSKYENASEALSVEKLLSYGADVYDKPVKIVGTVAAGSIASATADQRFVVQDSDTPDVQLPVSFEGGLPDNLSEGSSVVLTGALSSEGKFVATEVALEG